MSRAALAALLLAASGCASVTARLPPRAPDPLPDRGDWAATRDQASRRAQLYDGLVHRATASATWLSLPVREAATRRLAAWQGWTEAEVDKALVVDRTEATKGEEFIVALFTADRMANDLDGSPSIWHVEIDDGQLVAPASSQHAMTVDATLVQLFTYVGAFDVVYRVRVPWSGTPLAGRPFKLRLGSALGQLELDFGPGGEPAIRPHQAP
jgi:hypothetical protein